MSQGDVIYTHIEVRDIPGVPDYDIDEIAEAKSDSCLLIPVINEGERIKSELGKIHADALDAAVDVIICDGGSTDGSVDIDTLRDFGVRTRITKIGPGKQGSQLREGIHYALSQGYQKVLTVDGNDKDSVSSIPYFIQKLNEGYGYVQGSRFMRGGRAINTPMTRLLAARLIHAPLSSLAGRAWLTDTTNAFRGYSAEYLADPRVQPFRDVFTGYELLAYLCVRAGQLGYSVCEVPVERAYPATGSTPTKISGIRGNADLMRCLLQACAGQYAPSPREIREAISSIREGESA